MYRVRIKRLPEGTVEMREGGRVPERSFEEEGMQQGLEPVDREVANIEAERGETVAGDFDADGMVEHLTVKGKRHSEGGTPLQVPPGSFVFSDTKKLKIGGPVLREFGKSADTKQKYTPAQLAKQYEINKYKAILQNPNADKWERDTAELMIHNHERKLAKLALLQEGMKGFPTGVPGIAMGLVEEMKAASEGDEGEAGPSAAPQDDNGVDGGGQEMMMRRGGLVKAARGFYVPPIDPYKGNRGDVRKDQRALGLQRGFNAYDTPWLIDYGYENSPIGLEAALRKIGYTGNMNDNRAVQRFLIQQNLDKGNDHLFRDLLTKYKMTNQGVKAGLPLGVEALPNIAAYKNDPKVRAMLNKAFVDGLFGVRSGEMLQTLLPNLKPSMPKLTQVPLERGKIDVAQVVPQTITPPIPTTSANSYTGSDETKTTSSPNVTPGDDPRWTKAGKDKMPWWMQDKINMAAALGSRYNLQKYMPTYVSTNAVLPNPTFFDPTRQLAANQEAANAQNMMAALYAGPQRLRSVGSNIQGQGASNAANILGQVQNQNVGVANQFETMRSQILTNQALQNAQARKNYLDELATVNQQFDNSKKIANENIRANLISGISNAQRTNWVNKFSPQFNLDPSTGRISFTRARSDMFSGVKGNGMGGAGTSANMLTNYKAYYDEFMKQMPDVSKAHEFAQKMTFGTRSKVQADSDGDVQVSSSGVSDPSALALLQMMAPQYGR